MQTKQLAGCPPPAVAATARRTKPRPLLPSAQASVRTPGGELDESQALDRANDHKNPPQDTVAPQQVASVVPPSSTAQLASTAGAGILSDADGPLQSCSRTENLQGGVSNARRDIAAHPDAMAVAATTAAVAAIAAASSSAGSDSTGPDPVNRVNELAMSVMVMAELIQMLSSGTERQVASDELGQVMVTLEAAMRDVICAQAVSAEFLNQLRLRLLQHLPAPQVPHSQRAQIVQAHSTQVPSVGYSPCLATSASSVPAAEAPPVAIEASAWPPTISQDPVVLAPGNAEGLAVRGSDSASAPMRLTGNAVLHRITDDLAPLAGVGGNGRLGDGSSPGSSGRGAGGSEGGGAGGSSGGSSEPGNGGADGDGGGVGGGGSNGGGDAEAGGEGPRGGPGNPGAQLQRLMQLLSTLCLLLPPDRQVQMLRSLNETLISALGAWDGNGSSARADTVRQCREVRAAPDLRLRQELRAAALYSMAMATSSPPRDLLEWTMPGDSHSSALAELLGSELSRRCPHVGRIPGGHEAVPALPSLLASAQPEMPLDTVDVGLRPSLMSERRHEDAQMHASQQEPDLWAAATSVVSSADDLLPLWLSRRRLTGAAAPCSYAVSDLAAATVPLVGLEVEAAASEATAEAAGNAATGYRVAASPTGIERLSRDVALSLQSHPLSTCELSPEAERSPRFAAPSPALSPLRVVEPVRLSPRQQGATGCTAAQADTRGNMQGQLDLAALSIYSRPLVSLSPLSATPRSPPPSLSSSVVAFTVASSGEGALADADVAAGLMRDGECVAPMPLDPGKGRLVALTGAYPRSDVSWGQATSRNASAGGIPGLVRNASVMWSSPGGSHHVLPPERARAAGSSGGSSTCSSRNSSFTERSPRHGIPVAIIDTASSGVSAHGLPACPVATDTDDLRWPPPSTSSQGASTTTSCPTPRTSIEPHAARPCTPAGDGLDSPCSQHVRSRSLGGACSPKRLSCGGHASSPSSPPASVLTGAAHSAAVPLQASASRSSPQHSEYGYALASTTSGQPALRGNAVPASGCMMGRPPLPRRLSRMQSHGTRSEVAPLGLGGCGLAVRRSTVGGEVCSTTGSQSTRLPQQRSLSSPALESSLSVPSLLPAADVMIDKVGSSNNVASQRRTYDSPCSSEGWSPREVAATATLMAVPAVAATVWATRAPSFASTAASPRSAAAGSSFLSAWSPLGGGVGGWPCRSNALTATATAALVALPVVAAALLFGSGFIPSSGRQASHSRVEAEVDGTAAAVASGNSAAESRSPSRRLQSTVWQIATAAATMASTTREAAWRRLHPAKSARRGLWTEPAAVDGRKVQAATCSVPQASRFIGLADVLRGSSSEPCGIERLGSTRAQAFLPQHSSAAVVDYRPLPDAAAAVAWPRPAAVVSTSLTTSPQPASSLFQRLALASVAAIAEARESTLAAPQPSSALYAAERSPWEGAAATAAVVAAAVAEHPQSGDLQLTSDAGMAHVTAQECTGSAGQHPGGLAHLARLLPPSGDVQLFVGRSPSDPAPVLGPTRLTSVSYRSPTRAASGPCLMDASNVAITGNSTVSGLEVRSASAPVAVLQRPRSSANLLTRFGFPTASSFRQSTPSEGESHMFAADREDVASPVATVAANAEALPATAIAYISAAAARSAAVDANTISDAAAVKPAVSTSPQVVDAVAAQPVADVPLRAASAIPVADAAEEAAALQHPASAAEVGGAAKSAGHASAEIVSAERGVDATVEATTAEPPADEGEEAAASLPADSAGDVVAFAEAAAEPTGDSIPSSPVSAATETAAGISTEPLALGPEPDEAAADTLASESAGSPAEDGMAVAPTDDGAEEAVGYEAAARAAAVVAGPPTELAEVEATGERVTYFADDASSGEPVLAYVASVIVKAGEVDVAAGPAVDAAGAKPAAVAERAAGPAAEVADAELAVVDVAVCGADAVAAESAALVEPTQGAAAEDLAAAVVETSVAPAACEVVAAAAEVESSSMDAAKAADVSTAADDDKAACAEPAAAEVEAVDIKGSEVDAAAQPAGVTAEVAADREAEPVATEALAPGPVAVLADAVATDTTAEDTIEEALAAPEVAAPGLVATATMETAAAELASEVAVASVLPAAGYHVAAAPAVEATEEAEAAGLADAAPAEATGTMAAEAVAFQPAPGPADEAATAEPAADTVVDEAAVQPVAVDAAEGAATRESASPAAALAPATMAAEKVAIGGALDSAVAEALVPEAVTLSWHGIGDTSPELVAGASDTAALQPVVDDVDEAVVQPVANEGETATPEPVVHATDAAAMQPIAEAAETAGPEPVADSADAAVMQPVVGAAETAAPEPAAADVDGALQPVADAAESAAPELVADAADAAVQQPAALKAVADGAEAALAPELAIGAAPGASEAEPADDAAEGSAAAERASGSTEEAAFVEHATNSPVEATATEDLSAVEAATADVAAHPVVYSPVLTASVGAADEAVVEVPVAEPASTVDMSAHAAAEVVDPEPADQEAAAPGSATVAAQDATTNGSVRVTAVEEAAAAEPVVENSVEETDFAGPADKAAVEALTPGPVGGLAGMAVAAQPAHNAAEEEIAAGPAAAMETAGPDAAAGSDCHAAAVAPLANTALEAESAEPADAGYAEAAAVEPTDGADKRAVAAAPAIGGAYVAAPADHVADEPVADKAAGLSTRAYAVPEGVKHATEATLETTDAIIAEAAAEVGTPEAVATIDSVGAVTAEGPTVGAALADGAGVVDASEEAIVPGPSISVADPVGMAPAPVAEAEELVTVAVAAEGEATAADSIAEAADIAELVAGAPAEVQVADAVQEASGAEASSVTADGHSSFESVDDAAEEVANAMPAAQAAEDVPRPEPSGDTVGAAIGAAEDSAALGPPAESSHDAMSAQLADSDTAEAVVTEAPAVAEDSVNAKLVADAPVTAASIEPAAYAIEAAAAPEPAIDVYGNSVRPEPAAQAGAVEVRRATEPVDAATATALAPDAAAEEFVVAATGGAEDVAQPAVAATEAAEAPAAPAPVAGNAGGATVPESVVTAPTEPAITESADDDVGAAGVVEVAETQQVAAAAAEANALGPVAILGEDAAAERADGLAGDAVAIGPAGGAAGQAAFYEPSAVPAGAIADAEEAADDGSAAEAAGVDSGAGTSFQCSSIAATDVVAATPTNVGTSEAVAGQPVVGFAVQAATAGPAAAASEMAATEEPAETLAAVRPTTPELGAQAAVASTDAGPAAAAADEVVDAVEQVSAESGLAGAGVEEGFPGACQTLAATGAAAEPEATSPAVPATAVAEPSELVAAAAAGAPFTGPVAGGAEEGAAAGNAEDEPVAVSAATLTNAATETVEAVAGGAEALAEAGLAEPPVPTSTAAEEDITAKPASASSDAARAAEDIAQALVAAGATEVAANQNAQACVGAVHSASADSAFTNPVRGHSRIPKEVAQDAAATCLGNASAAYPGPQSRIPKPPCSVWSSSSETRGRSKLPAPQATLGRSHSAAAPTRRQLSHSPAPRGAVSSPGAIATGVLTVAVQRAQSACDSRPGSARASATAEESGHGNSSGAATRSPGCGTNCVPSPANGPKPPGMRRHSVGPSPAPLRPSGDVAGRVRRNSAFESPRIQPMARAFEVRAAEAAAAAESCQLAAMEAVGIGSDTAACGSSLEAGRRSPASCSRGPAHAVQLCSDLAAYGHGTVGGQPLAAEDAAAYAARRVPVLGAPLTSGLEASGSGEVDFGSPHLPTPPQRPCEDPSNAFLASVPLSACAATIPPTDAAGAISAPASAAVSAVEASATTRTLASDLSPPPGTASPLARRSLTATQPVHFAPEGAVSEPLPKLKRTETASSAFAEPESSTEPSAEPNPNPRAYAMYRPAAHYAPRSGTSSLAGASPKQPSVTPAQQHQAAAVTGSSIWKNPGGIVARAAAALVQHVARDRKPAAAAAAAAASEATVASRSSSRSERLDALIRCHDAAVQAASAGVSLQRQSTPLPGLGRHSLGLVSMSRAGFAATDGPSATRDGLQRSSAPHPFMSASACPDKASEVTPPVERSAPQLEVAAGTAEAALAIPPPAQSSCMPSPASPQLGSQPPATNIPGRYASQAVFADPREPYPGHAAKAVASPSRFRPVFAEAERAQPLDMSPQPARRRVSGAEAASPSREDEGTDDGDDFLCMHADSLSPGQLVIPQAILELLGANKSEEPGLSRSAKRLDLEPHAVAGSVKEFTPADGTREASILEEGEGSAVSGLDEGKGVEEEDSRAVPQLGCDSSAVANAGGEVACPEAGVTAEEGEQGIVAADALEMFCKVYGFDGEDSGESGDEEGEEEEGQVDDEREEERADEEEDGEGMAGEAAGLPLQGEASLAAFLAGPDRSFRGAAGSGALSRAMTPLSPSTVFVPMMRVAFAAAAEDAGSPAAPSAGALSTSAAVPWAMSPSASTSAHRDAKTAKSKFAKALKTLFKKGAKEGGGHAGDVASSVALSIGAPSTFAGMSEAASALEGLAGIDAFSFAGTSETGLTHGSAMTDPRGEYSSAASKERRRRKSMWKRMKRKLGKLMGLIPRSWEVEAMQMQEAAAAAAAVAPGPVAAGAHGQAEAGPSMRGAEINN